MGGVGGLGPRCTLDLMGWSMYLGSPPARGPSAEGGGGRLRGPGSRCVDLGSLVLGMSRGGRSLGMSRRGVAGLVGGTTGTTRGGAGLWRRLAGTVGVATKFSGSLFMIES